MSIESLSTKEISVTVEVFSYPIRGQKIAQIKLGESVLFSEVVYDNPQTPAEMNIETLFANKIRRILECDQ